MLGKFDCCYVHRCKKEKTVGAMYCNEMSTTGILLELQKWLAEKSVGFNPRIIARAIYNDDESSCGVVLA